MTARQAFALLAGGAVLTLPVCPPAAAILGLGAAAVAIDAADPARRAARRRARPVRMARWVR